MAAARSVPLLHLTAKVVSHLKLFQMGAGAVLLIQHRSHHVHIYIVRCLTWVTGINILILVFKDVQKFRLFRCYFTLI